MSVQHRTGAQQQLSSRRGRGPGIEVRDAHRERTASCPGLCVLGVGAQSVSATAVATLAPSQVNCGIPLAMCSKGSATGAPPFGLNVGQWYSSRFSAGGGISGNFNWIDFTPPSGGESELSSLMTGSGVCNLNVTTPVGQTGVLGNAMAKAFNSRFGLYMAAVQSVDRHRDVGLHRLFVHRQELAGAEQRARRLSPGATPTVLTEPVSTTATRSPDSVSATPTTRRRQRRSTRPRARIDGWLSRPLSTAPVGPPATRRLSRRGRAFCCCIRSAARTTTCSSSIAAVVRTSTARATSGAAGGPGSVGPQVPTPCNEAEIAMSPLRPDRRRRRTASTRCPSPSSSES